MTEKYQKLIQVAELLSKQLAKIEAEEIYSINLIDELHAGENAHSRILRQLLQYSCDGKYPLLESFVKNILHTNELIQIQYPQFSCEYGRVDVLIREAGKYAVIIENKIHEAVDQERQIETYVELVIKEGTPRERVFVVYLTRDGSKQVSDDSLTPPTKRLLDFSQEDSRFMPKSYLHDIFPWLEKTVLPNCAVKESLLIAALTQYIDYLKGFLNLKNEQLVIQNIMEEITQEELNITSLKEAIECKKGIDQLQNSVNNILNEKIQQIAKEKILNPLEEEVVKPYNARITDSQFDHYNTFIVAIQPLHWEKCCIRFEKYNNQLLCGICHINCENPISDNLQKQIQELMPGYKSSPWWPHERYIKNNFVLDGQEYWLRVESGEIKEFELIKQEFENIYKETQYLYL